jgi:hypothetical protein
LKSKILLLIGIGLIIATALAWLLMLPEDGHAAPSISSVTGTMTNGSSITIAGSGFGSGPTVVLFDDFEKGTNGANISTTTGSATVNNWTSSTGGGVPTYSNAAKHSGSLALQSYTDTSNAAQSSVVSFTASTGIFVSYWLYRPTGTNWPINNWKTAWWFKSPFSASPGAMDDYTGAVISGDAGPDTQGVIAFAFGCDDPGLNTPNRYGYSVGGTWGTVTAQQFALGTWTRQAYYSTGSLTVGVAKAWETGPSGTVQQLNDSGLYTMDSAIISAGGWDTLSVPGYAGGTDSGTINMYYDDVYVATGANAQARVEIGNNATYANCTNLAIITPTSWATGSIAATVRAGSFSAGSAYLFVTDSTGATSSGYAITMGAGGGGSTATHLDSFHGGVRH